MFQIMMILLQSLACYSMNFQAECINMHLKHNIATLYFLVMSPNLEAEFRQMMQKYMECMEMSSDLENVSNF